MVNWNSRKLGDLLLLANGIALALVINLITSATFFRWDFTEEGRYTMDVSTQDLLRQLDDDVFIEVYLEGDLNAGFRRLRKSVYETLEEFRVYSGNKVHYKFVDPAIAIGQQARTEFMSALSAKGVQPMNVIDNKNGQRTEKLVFPGAVIAYGGKEKGVMLLKGNRALGSEEVLNQSIESIEFEMSSAIRNLVNANRKTIGILKGHGELDSVSLASLRENILESYDIFSVKLQEKNLNKRFDILIVAKPTRKFTEEDKFVLDQFLLNGGKLLILYDRLEASMDSVSSQHYLALPYDNNLDDQFFKYGFRVNPALVQDLVSLRAAVVTGSVDGKAQLTPLEWPFYPLINHYADHAITRNLDATALKFANSIDTVRAEGIRKTPLLWSSSYARSLTAPVKISINDLRSQLKPENFSSGPIALAYLLEGKFSSLYKNRFLPAGADSSHFIPSGVESKLIIVADGDVARNDINSRTGRPSALGVDPVSNYTYANRELIMNMIDYLADDAGLIRARSKDLKIRPLDKEKINHDRMFWQSLNLLLPLALIVIVGIVKAYVRKRKYAMS